MLLASLLVAGVAPPPVRVDAANSAARVEPARLGFVNAVQIYAYREGALFQVYTAPGQVTDIALEPGEQLVGPGPVAAGDTARWLVGDTLSGSGATQRVHILLKPLQPGLKTNLVINTDRRTYHLELRATPATYMASVSWIYPVDQLIALKRPAAPVSPPHYAPTLDRLNFGYRVTGDRPPWRPLRVFDDGQQVWIEFPASVAQGELPPIWVLGDKDALQLVNFQVRGRFMVVDQLFARAELRLGAKRPQKVRIIAEGADRD